MKKQRRIIGRDDLADFPDFNLKHVAVKIDSGAYTSTIHCSKIQLEEERLKVVFLDKLHTGYTGEPIIFDQFQVKRVRSSNGVLQKRFSVNGTIRLFGKTYKTVFTLSQRSKMRYPVLLGRKILNNKFLIDTSKSRISFAFETQNDKNTNK